MFEYCPGSRSRIGQSGLASRSECFSRYGYRSDCTQSTVSAYAACTCKLRLDWARPETVVCILRGLDGLCAARRSPGLCQSSSGSATL